MDFGQVMKDWRRMCRSMDGNDPYEKCDKCPLGEEHVCTFEISDIQDDELQRVEEKVAAWVEVHPEPVYPTWHDWMAGLGLDPDDPIPADIAQKLGVRPKEG